jgi:hypothetical protein
MGFVVSLVEKDKIHTIRFYGNLSISFKMRKIGR